MPKKRQRSISYSEDEILRQQGLFEVEKLLKVRKVERLERLESTHGRYGIKKPNYARTVDFEYLVTWKGYGEADNSWEPQKNLLCENLLNDFWEKSNINKQYMIPGVEYDPEQDYVGSEPGSSTEDESEHHDENGHKSWDDGRPTPESMPMASPECDPPKEKLVIRISSPAKKRRVEPDGNFQYEQPDAPVQPASPEPTFSIDQQVVSYDAPRAVVHTQNNMPYAPQVLGDPIGPSLSSETHDMVADDYILWFTETPADVPLPCLKPINPIYFDPVTRSFQMNTNFVPMHPGPPGCNSGLDTTLASLNPDVDSHQYDNSRMLATFSAYHTPETYKAHDPFSCRPQAFAIDAVPDQLMRTSDYNSGLETKLTSLNHPAANSYQCHDLRMPAMFPALHSSDPNIVHNPPSCRLQALAIDMTPDHDIDMSLYKELLDPNSMV